MTWDSRAPVEPGYASGSAQPAVATQGGASKERVAAAVQEHRAEILDLSHRIHAHPEPAFEEHQAAAWVAEAVARHGYEVELPAGRLPRQFAAACRAGADRMVHASASWPNTTRCRVSGHGCGHNSMAASGVGAAIALAAIAPDLAGEIVFLGTPAEEGGGGKQIMIDDGLFEGLDAALLYHPSDTS